MTAKTNKIEMFSVFSLTDTHQQTNQQSTIEIMKTRSQTRLELTLKAEEKKKQRRQNVEFYDSDKVNHITQTIADYLVEFDAIPFTNHTERRLSRCLIILRLFGYMNNHLFHNGFPVWFHGIVKCSNFIRMVHEKSLELIQQLDSLDPFDPHVDTFKITDNPVRLVKDARAELKKTLERIKEMDMD
jgi:anti-sigma28 factor (negative regulator of flagellin synthesis)